MEKVLPESVQTLHLSGPLSLHEWQQLFELAPFGMALSQLHVERLTLK